jgi:hypothetical protein
MRGSDADAQSTRFYAQSWMAVALLMRRDREAFYRFERELENGADVGEALQRDFGMTLRDFEAAIRTLSTSEPIRIVVRDDEPQIDSAPLDRATLLYELGAFLAIVEGAEKEAARHFDAALALNPHHARTLAALQRFDEALQADPTDAEIRLKYAEWLMRDAIGPFAGVFEHGDLAPFRKARALAEEALKLGADEGRARGDLGVSYIVEDDPAPGIEPLRRAVELLPRRDDFALHLYGLLLRGGQREAADALFASRFERARDKQTAFAARNILLRVETDRANALSRAGKLVEAAEVVRRLAAATPDPRGRAELEQQAATLEATAEINRQIAIYNDAVADVNAGRRADARRKLDELLKIARDEKLRADARKLRREL